MTQPAVGTAASDLDRGRRLASLLQERVERVDSKALDVCSGPVVWLDQLRDLVDTSGHRDLVEARRPPRLATAPPPPAILDGWLDPDIAVDSRGAEPRLNGGTGSARSDPPTEVHRAFKRWLESWREWTRQAREADEQANRLEALQELVNSRAATDEGYELVLGVGLIAVTEGETVIYRRHLLSTPVDLVSDAASDTVRVVLPPTMSIRLDHLGLLTGRAGPRIRRCDQDGLAGAHPLSEPVIYWLDRWADRCWIGTLDTDLSCWERPSAAPFDTATLTLSPALMWRPRPTGQLAFCNAVAATLRAPDADVPLGWAQLVTPIDPVERRRRLA
jgi:hypothetical protein